MADRVIFYNREGVPLEELHCQAHCKWKLNGLGAATIRLAVTEPKLKETLIRYGNLVLVRHRAAGDWGGVIRTPETWDDPTVTITAKTAECLLIDRRHEGVETLEGSSGDIFESLIDLANQPGDTRLRAGQVDRSGSDQQALLEDEPLFSVLSRLRKQSGFDWSFEPAFDDLGHLIFKAGWWAQRGETRSVTLRAGHNLRPGGRLVVTKKEVANDVLAIEQTGAGTERRSAQAQDDDSISVYGRRQAVITVWGNDGAQANLDAAAQSEVRRRAWPGRGFKLEAVEPVAGETFPYLGLGDTLGLQLVQQQFGIETRVRITAKEYDDTQGYMPLAAVEVRA